MLWPIAAVLLLAACTGQPAADVGTASVAATAPDAGSEPGIVPGDAPLDGAQITVASKDHDEQLVLGHISALALRAAGADVTDELGLGGTSVVRRSLTSADVDHYWEYTGVGWFVHLGESDPISEPHEQWRRVAAADLANGVVWSAPAPFNNTYGIAVLARAADDLGDPDTLSDLGDLLDERPDDVTVCVEREFGSRDDGLTGMEAAYGYEIPAEHVSIVDAGAVFAAAATREPCNFAEVFTTDGRIAALGLKVLEDDRGYFPAYNAAPVFTAELYRRHGQALDALFQPIAAALTQEAITELNRRVSSEGEPPRAVARSFLEDNGLLPR